VAHQEHGSFTRTRPASARKSRDSCNAEVSDTKRAVFLLEIETWCFLRSGNRMFKCPCQVEYREFIIIINGVLDFCRHWV